ncbi:MAG: family 43 glycosylhydrolase [Acidobacteriaceae bacterium]|nr:family 43 glycosylhydrolase [Acidobacteriaceae bacterium]
MSSPKKYRLRDCYDTLPGGTVRSLFNTTRQRNLWKVVVCLLFSCAALAQVPAAKFALPFDLFERVADNPVISPRGTGFEAAGTFNPAVVKKAGGYVMLYRAQDEPGTSSLGYATSRDGIHFDRRSAPVLTAEEPYEKGGGVEDPRLTKIGSTYYLTYTGYNNVDGTGAKHQDAQLCLATSLDLEHWKRHGVIMPAYRGKWNVGWTKSGAILPQKIDGKYWMYYLGDSAKQGSQMGVAFSTDLKHWTDALDHPILSSRPGMFDSQVVEPGPPPILMRDGILLIYNGADDKLVYRTGWVVFDRKNPTKVLARSAQPIFVPAETWEKVGQVPNVVFVEGLVRQRKRWLFYYGGADKYVGIATAAPR